MMLTGNNGILQRTTDAKKTTERKSVVEQARMDVLGYQAENKDYNLDKKQLKAVLDTYFKDVPDLTDMEEKEILARELETLDKYGIYTITVSEIYNGNLKDGTPQITGNLNTDEIAGLPNGVVEIVKDNVENPNIKNNANIRAVITGEIPIPSGFYYVGGTIDEGVVISDSVADSGKGTSHAIAQTLQGNQFVWVPVPVAISSDVSTITTTGVDLSSNPTAERPMAVLQSGSTTNYQGVLYDFSGTTSIAKTIVSVSGTSGHREPAELNYDDGEGTEVIDSQQGITLTLLQSEYNSMVDSVNKYKGFYVSRYELGLDSDLNPVSKAATIGSDITTAASVKSNTIMWYGTYNKCKNMYNDSSSLSTQNVISQMIWGSQWDAMMNWMAKTGTAIGDFMGQVRIENDASTTGTKDTDIINNVYDLYGCNEEVTAEAYDSYSRVYRGGYGNLANIKPSVRQDYLVNANGYTATRITLYIK